MNNQFKKELPFIFLFVGYILMFTLIIQNYLGSEQTVVYANENVPSVTPTPSPVPQHFPTEKHKYIFEIFGKDYGKALLLLSGNDVCGGENKKLDPNAVNVNRDGSRDYSIFQINDVFHPVYKLGLDKDWKANVNYAKRMFDNDGGTFAKRWAAGKCLKANGFEI